MARFYGNVGYSTTIEKKPGIWVEEVVEYPYYGDIIRNARTLDTGEGVNPNLGVSNSISIVADAYAREHFFAIRYVEWAGALWVVSNVTVESPRLVLRLGDLYNGPRPVAGGDMQ